MKEGINEYQTTCGKENSLGLEVIYNLDFYFLLYYFPGGKPVASKKIFSKDVSYLVSTVF